MDAGERIAGMTKESVMAIRKATKNAAKPAAKTAAKKAEKPTTKKAAGKTAAAPRKTAAKGAATKTVKAGTKAAQSGVKAAAKPQTYNGSCHCGRIAFTVTGAIEQVMDCNCSMCRRRGGLLWFVPRDALKLSTPESDVATYTFNRHVLKHHFCPNCGVASFSEGESKGQRMACINVRSLDGVDLAKLEVFKYDGRSL